MNDELDFVDNFSDISDLKKQFFGTDVLNPTSTRHDKNYGVFIDFRFPKKPINIFDVEIVIPGSCNISRLDKYRFIITIEIDGHDLSYDGEAILMLLKYHNKNLYFEDNSTIIPIGFAFKTFSTLISLVNVQLCINIFIMNADISYRSYIDMEYSLCVSQRDTIVNLSKCSVKYKYINDARTDSLDMMIIQRFKTYSSFMFGFYVSSYDNILAIFFTVHFKTKMHCRAVTRFKPIEYIKHNITKIILLFEDTRFVFEPGIGIRELSVNNVTYYGIMLTNKHRNEINQIITTLKDNHVNFKLILEGLCDMEALNVNIVYSNDGINDKLRINETMLNYFA